MRRFTFDIWDLDVNLCKEIVQAFKEDDELLLVLEDYDSAFVKLNSDGLFITNSYKESPTTPKYEGSEYEKVVWVDELDIRTIEVSLQLYGWVEIVEIDSEVDLGDITLFVKIHKRRDPEVCF